MQLVSHCALALLTIMLASCGGGGGSGFAPNPQIALARVFPNLTFSRPVAMLQAPGDDTRWFVVEQSGVIRVFDNDPNVSSSLVFVDISALVGSSAGERGLFGIAFDPDFATNGRAYLSYTRSGPPLTSYVSQFTSLDGGMTLDPTTETTLLALVKPNANTNHNGGHIIFGPDELLYVAFGDGGGSNDPDDLAQDTTNLFGKIIRIDVTALPLPYTIPAGNPFFGNPRCTTGISATMVDCPEIYAWGLRNPWRFSFDGVDLWAGDVGQDAWEEVDLIENGGNYGWRDREGAHCNTFYYPAGGCPGPGPMLADPVAEYDHGLGESITGGYVYRGSQSPTLMGSYLFGDYITGRIFRLAPGGVDVEELLDTGFNIASFGESNDGEIYVVDYSGTLQQIIESP